MLVASRNFRKNLDARDKATMEYMNKSYAGVYARLQEYSDALFAEIVSKAGETGKVKPWKIARLTTMQSLMEQIAKEVGAYGLVVADQVQGEARDMARLGEQHMAEIIKAGFPKEVQATIGASFQMLPASALETATAFTHPDSQLMKNLTVGYGEAAARYIGDSLIAGIGLGHNPEETAKRLNRSMGFPLIDAKRTMRTAQLWAYRETNLAVMQRNSDLVSGWRWYSSLDATTCMACIIRHGQLFGLEHGQHMNDHHNGRCAMIPEIRPLSELGFSGIDASPKVHVEHGDDWFRKQSDEFQKKVMGQNVWEAWKLKKFKLWELQGFYQNDVYGTMVVTLPINQLLGAGWDKGMTKDRNLRKSGKIARKQTVATSTPVSDALDMGWLGPKRSKLRKAGETALAAIDLVHGDGPLPDIPVTDMNKASTHGEYRYNVRRGTATEIKLSRKSDAPELVMVHEVGHFLDHWGIGPGGDFATDAFLWAQKEPGHDWADDFENWWLAIITSDAHLHKQELMRMSGKERNDMILRGEKAPKLDYLRYLLGKREIWARSYAQYIAIRSGDPVLLQQLVESRRQRPAYDPDQNDYAEQWDDRDFTPIAEAMDKLFKTLGWLK